MKNYSKNVKKFTLGENCVYQCYWLIRLPVVTSHVGYSHRNDYRIIGKAVTDLGTFNKSDKTGNVRRK